jgi:RNA polymerase sigma-70 factor (ECF subfamily)
MRYLNHHEDAVDVTQETYIRFYEMLDRWNPARSLQNWLLTIVRNLSIDYLRRRRREKILHTERFYSPDSENPIDQIEHKERLQNIRTTVYQLKEPYRSILILKFNQGLSNTQIGQIMGIRKETLWVYIHRALQELKRRIRSYGEL